MEFDGSTIEIISNVGATGVLIYLTLWLFRSWLPKQEEKFAERLKAQRQEFMSELARQRDHFAEELKLYKTVDDLIDKATNKPEE